MKLIFILVCLFDSFFLYPQVSEMDTTVIITNYSEIDTIYFLGSDKIRALTFYLDNVKVQQIIYHFNGVISGEINYDSHGGFDGLIQHWHSNGQKESETFFVNDMQEGKGYGWDENGKLNIIHECEKGDCITYYLYPSGNVSKLEKHYKERIYEVMYFCENGLQTQVFYPGKPLDPYYQYDCNGDRIMIGKLNANGTLVGKFEAYYSKGHLREKGEYKEHDGLYLIKIGTWYYYDEKGNLYLQENYDANGNLLKSIKNPKKK